MISGNGPKGPVVLPTYPRGGVVGRGGSVDHHDGYPMVNTVE